MTEMMMTTINSSTKVKALFLMFISNKYWQQFEDSYPQSQKNASVNFTFLCPFVQLVFRFNM